MIYPSFADLSNFKVSLVHEELHEEASVIENNNFVGCYATWLKDDIYAVTNINIYIYIYIYMAIQRFFL